MKNKILKTILVLSSFAILAGCATINVPTTDTSTDTDTSETTGDDSTVVTKGAHEVVNIYNQTGSVYSSTAAMVEDVLPSVCDVYAYNSSGYSCGSGVIIGEEANSNGYYVVTNHHVIADCSTFEVETYTNLGESTKYNATLVGGSPAKDIACLYITSDEKLTVATWGDSSNLKVGQDVIAIGNPLGTLSQTVTKGIISSLAREQYFSDTQNFMTLLQTDAAINSGNSGGALFDTDGNLVGIVNSGYSSYEGLNFAIPSNDANKSITSLISTWDPDNNSLGYVKGDCNLGINWGQGYIYDNESLNTYSSYLYINSFESTSCDGYKAGLKDYSSNSNGGFNVITKINGVDMDSAETLIKTVSKLQAGETVTFTVKEVLSKSIGMGRFSFSSYPYIGNEEKTVTVTLTQYKYTI